MKLNLFIFAAAVGLLLVATVTRVDSATRPLLIGRQCRQIERIQLASQIALETLNQYGALNASTLVETVLDVAYLAQTGNGTILDEAQRLREMAASTAVVLSFGPEAAYISQELSLKSIPTFALNAGDIRLRGASFSFEAAPSLVFNAGLQLLQRMNWQSVSIIYSSEFFPYVELIQSQLNSSGISIGSVSLVAFTAASSTEKPYASVVTALERQSSRVIVALTSWKDLYNVVNCTREIMFEFVWLIPPEYRSGLREAQMDISMRRHYQHQIQGILAIHLSQNFTAQTQLLTTLKSRNSTLFPSNEPLPLAEDVVYAHDAILLWGRATARVIASGFEPTNFTAILAEIRQNQLQTGRTYGGGNYTFDTITGERSGAGHVTNLRFNDSVASLCVGSFIQGSSLVLQQGSIIFADGSQHPQPAVGVPTITIGLIWPRVEIDPAFYQGYFDAAAVAVSDINENGNIVPGAKLLTVFRNNEDSVAETILAGIELMSRGAVALVGPDRSSQAIALQYYVGGLNITAVSFSATSDTLSDKSQYPSFFRTILPDRVQGRALASVLDLFNWKRICMLHFVDDYASNLANSLLQEGNKDGRSLEIVIRSTFRIGQTNFTQTLTPLQNAKCRIILAVVDNVGPLREAKSLGLFGPSSGVQWIFPETAAQILTETVISQAGLPLSDFNGVLMTQPLIAPSNSSTYDHFSDSLLRRTGRAPGAYSTFLYDAIYAVARACGQLLQLGIDPAASTSRRLLHEALQSQRFEGVSGPISFDENHDRVGAVYALFNFLASSGGLTNIGVWDESAGLKLSRNPIFFDGTTTIPPDRLVLPLASLLFSLSGSVSVIVLTSAALLIVAVLTPVLLVYWRSNKLIVRSSPAFLATIAVGLSFALASIFFWFDNPTVAMCHLRLWFGILGCAVAYTSVLTKNWRLFTLFNEPRLRATSIANFHVFGATALLCAPLVIVLVLWSSLVPIQVLPQLNASNSMQYISCVSINDRIFAPIAFAYMALMFLVGAVVSYKVRVLPDTFRESFWLALVTYNLLFVTTVGIILGYILSFEPSAYPFIITICLLFGVLVTWALIFAPKFWLIYFHPDQIEKSSNEPVEADKSQIPRSDFTIQSAFSLSFRSEHSDPATPRSHFSSVAPMSGRSAPGRHDFTHRDDEIMQSEMSRRSARTDIDDRPSARSKREARRSTKRSKKTRNDPSSSNSSSTSDSSSEEGPRTNRSVKSI